jgi:WD40 repeat protein
VHPDWLVISETDQSPADTYVEDVADPSNPSQLAYQRDVGGGDIVITPDGATLLTSSSGEVDGYSLPSLSQAGVYPTDDYPNAVAVSPDGTKIAGGSMAFYDKDVFVFNSGNSTPVRTYDFGSTTDLLCPRGLAFSADGRSVYAVGHCSPSAPSAAPVLRVLSALPAPPAGSVSIKASAGTINAGKSVTLTAHLGTPSTNHTVAIYRQPVGTSTPVLVTTGTIGASGNVTFAVRPSQDTVYTARWAGDASYGAATSAGARVNVRLVMHRSTVGGYRTSSGIRLYHFTTRCEKAAHTGCPAFLAWSSPLQPGRTISFLAQGRTRSGKWVTVAKGSHAAGSSGRLKLTLFYRSNALIGVTQRIRFSIASSTKVLGATSSWISFRVTR